MKWSLFALLLLLFYYFTPSKISPPEEFKGVAMTVPYRLLVGSAFVERGQIEEIIASVFKETHDHFNKWNEHSETSKINKSEAFKEIPLSEGLYLLLKKTDEAWHLTEGRFDPTVESARKWGNSQIWSWKQLYLSEKMVIKSDSRVEIDLGGIAKGYTLDRLLEALKKAGYNNVLIEWGGDFVAAGVHPENRPWVVGIFNPEDPNSYVEVELKNEALATSGDYLQKWEEGGKNYTHIYDPKSGVPLEITNNSIASVSVKAPNATLADAVATAMMLFSNEAEAKNFIETKTELKGLEFWFILHSQPEESQE